MHHGGPGFMRRSIGNTPTMRPSFKLLITHFGPFFGRYKWSILTGTGCVGLSLVCRKMRPLITRFLVDHALTPIAKQPWTEELYNHSITLVGFAIAGMLFLALMVALISSVHSRIMRSAGAGLVRDIRIHVYDHLQKLSLSFYDSRQTGDIMSRITGDVNALERLVAGFSDRLLTNILNVVATLIILLCLSWKLALVALIPIPILIGIMYWFSKHVRPIYRQVRDQMGNIHAKLQDNISGIRIIKAFNTEDEPKLNTSGV